MVETVDALELEISTRSGGAADAVERLAASVSDLGKNVGSYIGNLNSLAIALNSIASSARELSGIKGLGSLIGKVSGATGAAKRATGVGSAAAAAKKAGDDWKRAMFKSQQEYEKVFPPRSSFAGQRPDKIITRGQSPILEGDVSHRATRAMARSLRQEYGTGTRGMPLQEMSDLIAKVRGGSGRYNGANQAWMTNEAKDALADLSRMVNDRARPARPDDFTSRLSGISSVLNVRNVGDLQALNSADMLDKKVMSEISGKAMQQFGVAFRDLTGNQLEQIMSQLSSGKLSRLTAGINRDLEGTGIRVSAGRNAGMTAEELKDPRSGAAALGLNPEANITAKDILDKVYHDIGERRNDYLAQQGAAGTGSAQENLANDLMARILDIPVRGEKGELAPEMKGVEDMLRAQHELNMQSGAYKESSEAAKSAAEEAVAEAKNAASNTGDAARIEKEIAAAWAGHNRWNNEQNRNYREDHKFNWKEAEGYLRTEARANAVPDNTAREIAEWKAAEDERYEAGMQQLAEGIVQDRSTGGMLLRDAIDKNFGIGNEPKDRLQTALAIENGLRERENEVIGAYNKQVAEGIVSGKYWDQNRNYVKEGMPTLRDAIDKNLGIGKEPLNAKEIGLEMKQALDARDAAEKAAREAAERANPKPFNYPKDAKVFNPMTGKYEATGKAMPSIQESKVQQAEEKRLEGLKDFVAHNTPAKLVSEYMDAKKSGDLEGWKAMRGNIPQVADDAVKAGLIDKSMAESIKGAAGMGGGGTAAANVRELLETLNKPMPKMDWAKATERMLGIGAPPISDQKSLEKVFSQLPEEKPEGAPTIAPASGAAEAVKEVKEEAEGAAGSVGNMNGQLADTGAQNGPLKETGDNVKEIGDSAKDAEENTVTLKSALSATGKMIGKSIVGQLARVAKMRALRAIIRGIAAGFKEGLTNMYQWSDAMGGHFAQAMDTFKSKTTLAKNSIATAFGPAIEALMPTITTLIGWLNTACNALAQFFALLNGQSTWTKALETSEKWGKTTAGGASKADDAVKDLLADWDELNIIQSQTGDGSGGGGGGGSNVKDMFEETNVFDEWTRHFETVLDIVKLIGIGIAGWTLVGQAASFLKNIGFAADKVDGIASRVKKGIVGAVMLAVGFKLSQKAGEMYADEGFTWGAFVTQAIGIIASGMGGAILASSFGVNPVIGLALGIGLSIYATISSYYGRLKENAKKYVKETLEQEVYKFDVTAVAENVKVQIANVSGAQKDAEEQLSSVFSTMDLLALGLDESRSWARLEDQILNADTGLITKIKNRLSEEKNYLTFYYQFQQSPEGGGIVSDGAAGPALKMHFKANNYLESWYTTQGEKFGECFVKGENGKIRDGMEETALTIAQQIADAEAAAERGRSRGRYRANMIDFMRGTNKETVLKEWGGVIDEENRTLAEARRNADREYLEIISGTLEELKATGASDDLISFYEREIADVEDRLLNNDYVVEIELEFKAGNKDALTNFLDEQFAEQRENIRWMDFGNTVLNDLLGNRALSSSAMASQLSGNLYKYANSFYGLGMDDTTFSRLGIGFEHILSEDVLSGVRDMIAASHDMEYAAEVFRELGIGDEMMERLFPNTSSPTPTPLAAPEERAPAVAEAVEAGAEAAAEAAEALTEASEVFSALDSGELAALANYWREQVRYERYGGSTDAVYAAADQLAIALADKPELYGSVLDLVDNYIDTHEDWFSSEDLPDDFFTVTLPDESVEVDGRAAGMAMDSTVGSLSASVGTGMEKQSGTLDRILTVMQQVQTNTLATANKEFRVTVAPGSLVGAFVNRSNAAFGRVSG